MTTSALATDLAAKRSSSGERAAANQLRRVLEPALTNASEQTLRIADAAGQAAEIVLTPRLSRLLRELLEHVGRGEEVGIVAIGQTLTTQQAADILNVSRPFLISLLEKSRIPHTMVGRHRRIEMSELLAYKRIRDEQRAASLSELAELDSDLI